MREEKNETVLSLHRVLALCLAAFTGCAAQQSGGEQQPTDAPEATEAPAPAGEDDALERATDYLRMLYKDGATKTPADYQVVAGVVVEDIAYPITWTVTITGGAQDAVVVGEKVDGMITIDINESASEECPYRSPRPSRARTARRRALV